MNYLVLSRLFVKNVTDYKDLPHKFNSKDAPITASLKSSFVKVGKGKVLNHPNAYKWDYQGAIICHSLLNPKNSGEVR